jgi:lysophospholipase L1-like esterase
LSTVRRKNAAVVPVAGLLAAWAAFLAASPAHAAVKVMVVGDSMSQGSSGDYTWRYRLWQHLQSTAPGMADFVGERTDLFDNVTNQHGSHAYRVGNFDRQHHATWGRLLVDEKLAIGPAITNADADTILVLLGINDVVWLNLTPAQVASEMRQLVANARTARPGVDIVIGHLLPRYDPWTGQALNQAAVADINGRFNALATELSTSSSRIRTAVTTTSWAPESHTWDGTHPNATGEYRIAGAFANALAAWGIGTPYGPLPAAVAWPAAGTQPTAVPRSGALDLSWPAVPGATGYFIEQKIVSFNESSFTRLPYPVGGTAWTAGLLLPGAVVQYRVVPGKGLMTGRSGPEVQATVGGTPPTGAPVLDGWPLGEHDARLTWGAVPNATAYYVWQATLTQSGTYNWQRLPYPLHTTTFDPGLMHSGSWYAYRVQPLNGFLEGPLSNTVEIRTRGLPYGAGTGHAYVRYYALGDSYSSGLGAGGSGGYTGGDCLRTTNAYAYDMHYIGTVHHLACANETIPTLRSRQLGQIDHPSNALITVTIGGNDVGFGPVLQDCATPGNPSCAPQEPGIAAAIDALKPQLVALYQALRLQAPGADIVAGGYPLLIRPPGSGDCNVAINSVLKDDEKLMMRRLATRLNNVIHAAALEARVFSAVPQVLAQFDGHEACSTDGEYVNQNVGPLLNPGPGSFHPNLGGQLAYAVAFSERLVYLNASGATRP